MSNLVLNRLDMVLVSVQDRCTVCAKHTIGDSANLVESRFSYLETVLVLVQDRCMVCAKHTIGSEVVLDPPDGTPR